MVSLGCSAPASLGRRMVVQRTVPLDARVQAVFGRKSLAQPILNPALSVLARCHRWTVAGGMAAHLPV